MFSRLAILLGIILLAPGVFADDNTDPFEGLVESYRKMIILADAAAGLPEGTAKRSQAVATARYHYSQGREHLETLIHQARHDTPLTPSNRLISVTTALISFTEGNKNLRDGDLLAFLDLLDELTGIERFRLGEGPRLAPIRALNERVADVLEDYRKEYSRAMGAITRGQKRESWDDYIAAISVEHSFEQLLAAAADEEMVKDLERLEQEQKTQGNQKFIAGAPRVVWGGGLPEKTVVLTFDDGPHNRRTNTILDVLGEYGATAYFFVLGKNLGTVDDEGKANLGSASATARRIVDEGHVLANHSYSHPVLSKLPKEDQAQQLSQTNQLIKAIGGSNNTLFRPPYGAKNDKLDAMAKGQGMASIMWNVDSMDWADPVPESIVDRTIRALEKKGRGILLFHDIHRQTVDALPDLLAALAERDYRVVALDGTPFNEKTQGKLTPPKREVDIYGESWAVVIGIDSYQHWPKLERAANDARAVGDMLVNNLGFREENVIRLYNEEATRERIVDVLGYEMAEPDRIGENDRVFVFFAGHGMTRPLADGGSLGYIIPVDADAQRYQTRAISMNEIDNFSAAIPAKHLFFVMDSCYSGLALTRSGVTVGQTLNYLERITSRRGRQILTAGGADEEVADGGPGNHSIFSWALLQGLSGLADTDSNGYVSASELGTYLTPVVSSYSEQTPVFGNLVGSGGGDFVFKIQEEALTKVNQQISKNEAQVEQQLEALRQDTEAPVKRLFELQMALENGEPAKKEPVKKPAKPGVDRIREANARDAQALKDFRAGKYEDARKQWAEAVRLNPYNPNIVNNYGFVLDTMGEYEEALKWYYRTVELTPRRTPIYLNLGDIMVKMGRNHDAIPYYERYLHLYPSYEKADELRQKIEELSKQEAVQPAKA